uniref:Ig-like domain-containing protein n=1 Tax=Chrysemys picta bellii TaxID=8478 RepID=A0A8C3FVV2_CHRPI
GELSYPKPSISLSPSGGVPLGGAVTVWCRGWGWNMRFLLYKDGNLTTLQDAEPAGDLAEFLIRNVSWRDAGSYSCYYHHYWYSFIWSHPSDPVELVLSYPKPSILLSPSGVVPLGGAVTVQCWGWHWHWHWYQNMRFLLYKDGNPNMLQDVEPRWDLADFLIRNVSWRDAGSYGCYYYSHWNPLIWSHPSDPVELVVAGELPGSVSPLPAPHPARLSGAGAFVTIRCQCRCGARRLFLYKGGMEIQELDAAGDGGEFTIPSARWEDGGAYSCRSHSRSEPPDWSYPSDTVWIIVAGERPSSASRLPAPPPARHLWGGSRQMGNSLGCHLTCLCLHLSLCTLCLVRSSGLGSKAGSFSPRVCAAPSTSDSQPPPDLTTSPHSPPRARDRTQESWLPGCWAPLRR